MSGFEVTVDFSVFFIAALLVFNLGARVFPSWHPEWSAALSWGVAVAAALLFFVSVLLHELSHAFVGRRVGIPISGITLFIFGGMAHMTREPQRPRAEFLMAIVGPLTSIVIGVLATVAATWLGRDVLQQGELKTEVMQRLGPGATLLFWLGPLNIMLGLFNLVPGFPLDGGRVFRAVLWWALGDFRRATQWAAFVGQLVAWTLLSAGVFMIFGFSVPILGTGFSNGLWLLLIGWFLNNAARMSYQSALLRESLAEIKVHDLMQPGIDPVSPDIAVTELIEDHLLRGKKLSFPVLQNGSLMGVVGIKEVRRISAADAPQVRVSEIMTPLDRSAVISANSDAGDAMNILSERDVDELPVAENGILIGMIRRQDIVDWLRERRDRDHEPAA